MVISNIIGGLGNQMFQYAAGRALSLVRGDTFKLDISSFANYGLHHGFELEKVFNCPVELSREAEVRGVLGWQYAPAIRGILSRPSMAVFRRAGFVVEPNVALGQAVHGMHRDCYLLGYWQSEKYFKDIFDQVRADFSFRMPLKGLNVKLADQIYQLNSVSLHVRRGDYVNDVGTNAVHGLCSLDYYRESIGHIASRVQQPHFFIFSDDIDWVKANLSLDFPHYYIGHNKGAESYNDMQLMSFCKNHIVANSSFSWWGAWLSRNASGIVIAPRRWYTYETKPLDLIPESWIVL